MLKDFSEEKLDIMIQAGQSNSAGCGIGDVPEPFEPNGDIWYLNDNFTISLAQEQVVGNSVVANFSLTFADDYIKKGRLENGRKLLILRTAAGGTGFCDKRWGLEDDLFLRMMDMIRTALALNNENRLVAFLWHQGENDASQSVPHDVHYKNLKTLINTVRNTFNCENLPVVAADFVQEWEMKNRQICEPVVKAMKDVCSDIGNAKFLETTNLLSNNQKFGNEDDIHFCREALYQMGHEYYKAFEEIVG